MSVRCARNCSARLLCSSFSMPLINTVTTIAISNGGILPTLIFQILTNKIDFVIDTSTVSDKTKIANGFNDYFVNVGSTLFSNIDCNVNPLS